MEFIQLNSFTVSLDSQLLHLMFPLMSNRQCTLRTTQYQMLTVTVLVTNIKSTGTG